MCACPLPPSSALAVSKSNLVYFEDKDFHLYTIEHPLTQRYLKVLERQRIDSIALRGKPAVLKLQSTQPDILFHLQFTHLQIPCQDCGLGQSTIHCHQCIASYCESCHSLLHHVGGRSSHTSQPTAAGSNCSSCAVKKPNVFCADCTDYFCFACFGQLHKKGKRVEHQAMRVTAVDGNVVAISNRVKCDECLDMPASVKCDFCTDSFCLGCFWRCHLNGIRRHHTASQISIRPLCNQCDTTRASVYCEQCQELLCTDCCAKMHVKGSRKLHLFMDAMNTLLLLERLDPSFQAFMLDERKRVMWAITKIQASMRGYRQREQFRRRREFATRIQRRWRGGETRRKLMGVLDQFHWRKKQVNDFLVNTPHDSKLEERDRRALDSRVRVAVARQNTIMEKLRSGLQVDEEADPRGENEAPVVPLQAAGMSPKAQLKSRLKNSHKDGEKLRKLLSLADDDLD